MFKLPLKFDDLKLNFVLSRFHDFGECTKKPNNRKITIQLKTQKPKPMNYNKLFPHALNNI